MLPPHAVFPKRRGIVKVHFGKPIYPDKHGPNLSESGYDAYKKIADEVKGEILKLRDKKDSI